MKSDGQLAGFWLEQSLKCVDNNSPQRIGIGPIVERSQSSPNRMKEPSMFVYLIYVVIFIVSLILMYWFFKWLNKH